MDAYRSMSHQLSDENYFQKLVHVSKTRRFIQWSSGLKDIVEGSAFSTLTVALILLNAVFIAYSSDLIVSEAFVSYDLMGGEPQVPGWISIVDAIFVGAFTVELLIRLVGQELSFWVGPDMAWNILDTFLVLSSLTEVAIRAAGFSFTYIRLLHVLRMLKTIRVIRVLRFFRELRIILYSILHSIIPLFWSLAFLCMIVFVFTVISLQSVSDYVGEAPPTDVHVSGMRRYFPNLWVAARTHFAAVSSGINWLELVDLLDAGSRFYVWVFSGYVILMVLMVLNIITGIFVNNALDIAQTHKDFAVQAVIERREALFQDLRKLFQQLDQDRSGRLTLGEFQTLMDNPEVRGIFGSLEVDAPDAVSLFHLLDADGSMELEIEEFVIGCMKLKGAAKAVDMETLLRENKRMMQRTKRQIAQLASHFDQSLQCALNDRRILQQGLITNSTTLI